MQSEFVTAAEEVIAEQYTQTRGVMNGSHLMNTTQSVFPGVPGAQGMNKITMEQVDPATLEDSDDSEDGLASSVLGIKPGKKTKGRVKIKMEFIENKLRRYTTFSKRKTGIMKKAYELSTLTGTQVMLLVASETGHVYTFATRKLQPMITSESGKALIQTCLNSPDPPPGSHQAVEQRMNPTGFEETELSYAVSEEENKLDSTLKPVLAVATLPPGLPENTILTPNTSQNNSQGLIQSSMAQPVQTGTYQVSQQMSVPATSTTTQSKQASMSMQLPGLPPGTVLVPPGTPLIPIQQNGQHMATNQQTSAQTVYRIPNTNQLVSIPGGSTTNQQEITADVQTSNVTTVTSNQATTGNAQSTTALPPGVVMFHTPQGIVYASSTATLQDRSVFNIQQPAALTVPSQADGGQQIITIPVPVSLTGSPQVLQFTTTTSDSSAPMTLSQPSAPKKSRK